MVDTVVAVRGEGAAAAGAVGFDCVVFCSTGNAVCGVLDVEVLVCAAVAGLELRRDLVCVFASDVGFGFADFEALLLV